MKKIIHLVCSHPIMIASSVTAFFMGVLVSSLDTKILGVIIGGIAAATAFLGVIYSKNAEEKIKQEERKLEKIEEFILNVFELLESIEAIIYKVHSITTEEIKIAKGDYTSKIDVDEENLIINMNFSKIFSLRGKINMYISIYGNYIGCNEILKNMIKEQDKVLNSIHDMRDSEDLNILNTNLESTLAILKNNRIYARELTRKLKQ